MASRLGADVSSTPTESALRSLPWSTDPLAFFGELTLTIDRTGVFLLKGDNLVAELVDRDDDTLMIKTAGGLSDLSVVHR